MWQLNRSSANGRFQWQVISGCWEPITEAEPRVVGFCLSAVPVTGSKSNLFPAWIPATTQLDRNDLCLFLLFLLLPLSLINRHVPRICFWKNKSFWYAAPFYASADQCLSSSYKIFSKLTFGIVCSLKSISVPVNRVDAWSEQCLFDYILWGGGLFFFLKLLYIPCLQ